MGSVSGLNWSHRKKARALAKHAALLGVRHEREIHYTQGPRRWEGIEKDRKAWKLEYPNYADCSAFTTWCLWNGLSHYQVRDTVNGTNWQSGYTGTQKRHGKRVMYRWSWRTGDLIHYGAGTGSHVAIYIGAGQVVSHGSEAGPMILPWDYRMDFAECRRYV